jgi:surface protein
MQKQIAKDFFKKHPASESQVDWNKSATLTYKDFEKIFDDANNTKNSLKKATKTNPRILFEKRDGCKVVGENSDFIFVLPLSYENCVWMDSFDCGGAGAKWCIGYEKNRDYYKKYYEDGYSFILAFNKYPTDINNDLKYMIQVDPIKLEAGDTEDAGKCWTQDDDPNRTFSILDKDRRNVEKLTGITKEQLIEYGKEYKKIVDEKEREREEKLNIFVYKEVLWKDLPNVVKNSEVSLSIKILDPENVVLGNSSLEGTLGNIIQNNIEVKFDFSPSDFSNSKLLDDTESMFYECENLVKMCKLPSSIINANRMFDGCMLLISIDTSTFINVKSASAMFANCTSLTSIDTSYFTNVTNARFMFYGCSKLDSIDTTAFINVTDASSMFSGCKKLASVDTAAFTKVTNASSMFSDCTSLVSIDKATFKNVTSAGGMFSYCTSLASIDMSSFNNVTDSSRMFYHCTKLTSVDLIALKNVINSSCMLYDCESLTSIDIASFINAISADHMFSGCKKLELVNNYSLVVGTRIYDIFLSCESLKEIRFSSGTEYLEQYEKLITNNEGNLSNAQIENAKMYSSSPIIRFKRD